MGDRLDETVARTLDALGAAEGEPLTEGEQALVTLGLAASLPCLNPGDVQAAIARAFATGATPAQAQEVVSLVSGLGVHSLMISAAAIVEQGRAAGFAIDATLSPAQQALWDARVGDDPFWDGMEQELPGFLRAMLLLSPAQFEAFFDYCAVPWASGTVRARLKELIAMASDAMATHMFLPGLRLHLRNAVKLGAGRVAIRQCLALAAATPAHAGIA